MKRLLILLLFLSLSWACAESSPQIKDVPTPFSLPKASTPERGSRDNEKRWEAIYFPTINDRLKDSGVINLRELEADGENAEIRLWFGFDTTPTRGIVVKHVKNETSVWYLPPLDSKHATKEPVRLSEPLHGSDHLWSRLDALNIFSLPDPLDIAKIDGGGYPTVVVEVKNKDGYRNYKYSGVGEVQSPNHKRVFEICTLLFAELGFDPTKYIFAN